MMDRRSFFGWLCWAMAALLGWRKPKDAVGTEAIKDTVGRSIEAQSKIIQTEVDDLWAPGIWAQPDLSGLQDEINAKARIVSVDLQSRTITVDSDDCV